MFNLPLWLLLVQSGRGVKAINRHAGLFISLQVKSWCWYSCNKACFHCEEFGSTVFSLRGSSFCLPEIERWSCQSHCRCKVWGELSTVQITGATTRAKEERISLARKAVWSRYKPRGVCTAWVRGGENWDYRVREKVTKGLEETVPSFSCFACTGWINFFPIVRVFFHADWSAAGLSQQLDSEERRSG